MDTLYEAVIKQAEKKYLRFHMPGHKGKNILGFKDIAEIDLTEIDGLDNLHVPSGCIAVSERLMAELCGAGRSFFIVNGASAGIIASILAMTSEKRRIVCARNSHISLFKGLCLSGAKPVYVMPEIIPEYGITGGIDAGLIEVALKHTENVGAVFITSPTYEGITSDISKIAETAHRYGAKLIVDEAHGSHFKFGKGFPKTAIEQGADISIQSWHKTLTAFGQGAVLHTGHGLGEDETERLGFCLSLMQTTSPSYVIMASIDRTREVLQKKGDKLFEEYEANLKHLRDRLSGLRNIKLVSSEIKGKNCVSDFDAGKITLYLKRGGKALDAYLRGANIYAEMSGVGHVVLMTSFADNSKDYNALQEAVCAFDASYAADGRHNPSFPPVVHNIPKMAYTPRESMNSRSKTVPFRDALGKVSAGFITPYPPGIPIAAPGEIITEEIVRLCGLYKVIDINGVLEGGNVRVLE